MRLSDRDFSQLIEPYVARILSARNVAVAVSGGGDSLALLYLLSRWAKKQKTKITIHAITVDHGLRAQSKAEAKQVAAWVADWPCVTHTILTWNGAKPKTRIAETARAKRYELIYKYCRKHDVPYVMLAHQMEDQAETFLLRLAAGSGLDGLACMRPVDTYVPSRRKPGSRSAVDPDFRRGGDALTLLRPLLSVSHDDLIATLRAVKQKWIEDPTNQNQDYARPRLRAVREVLAKEGLTPQRLAKTASRVLRGVEQLEHHANEVWAQIVQGSDRQIIIDLDDWHCLDDDTQMRILGRALAKVGQTKTVARLEQIETLQRDLQQTMPATIRRTLAGCIITRGAKILKISTEVPSRRKSGSSI